MSPDNTKEIKDVLTKEQQQESIKENIDFILSHFDKQHELFPRTIMSAKNKYQMKIEFDSDERNSKDIISDYFEKSGFIDCKINAFPFNTKYTRIDFEVKNRTAADFLMFDLDLQHFENKEKLDKQLIKISKNLTLKFNKEAYPTILWTGNGYHIYQPIDGIVFEQYEQFYGFLPYLDGKDLTTVFIRFAEKFLSNNKADPKHNPSIKSCLVRIPGTFNSKNAQQIKIIQKWDGKRPSVKWIASDFFDHLIDKRNEKIKSKYQNQTNNYYYNNTKTRRIKWIENLLLIPMEDHRKYCLFRILVPYLINTRKLSPEKSSIILQTWLTACNQMRPLDFNPIIEIRKCIKYVEDYRALGTHKLKVKNPMLYHELKTRNILSV